MKKTEKKVQKQLENSLLNSGKAREKKGMKIPPVMKGVMKKRGKLG